MLSLLFIFLFHKVPLTSAVDTIVSPQKDINWTSQTFIIPPGALPKDPGQLHIWSLKIGNKSR